MQTKLKKLVGDWCGVLIIVSVMSGLTIGLRWTGWLQPLEWMALDTFFQLRPLEPPDERIVIVGVQESDIQKLEQWPISDKVLATLLNKIKQQKPRAIGLDIYRDLPVSPGHEELLKVFRSTPNLVGVQKVIGNPNSKIAPPPQLERLQQVSAVDVVTDGDGVVRRGMLYVANDKDEQTPSLGLGVAAIYLQKQGITSTPASNGFMKFNQTQLEPFKANDGGYVQADAGGQQILLNYRGPTNSFPQVSLMDVLEDRIFPNLMRDHIVLIGVKAESLNDFFYIPYSRGLINTPTQTSGVEIHANVASQILSSVLDSRSSITVWSKPGENFWIIFWAGIIVVVGWRLQDADDTLNFSIKFSTRMLVALLTGASVLIIFSYSAFIIDGLWTPVVAPLIALCGSAIVFTNYTYISKLRESKASLELKVKERTQELNNKNEQLEQALQQLEAAQEQLIAQARLAFLGETVQEYAHDLNNPLTFINSSADDLIKVAHKMQEEIDEQSEYLDVEDIAIVEIVNGTLPIIVEYSTNIYQFGERAGKLLNRMQQYAREGNFERESIDINSLVKSSIYLATHSLLNTFNYSNIKIKTNYGSSISEVEIVVEDIRRVLINLLDNACYAVYIKSQKLGEEFTPEILVETINLGETVQISVRDNGQGIPQEVLGKIFDRSFTTKPLGEGTGLGLYISHTIIEQEHKGKIKVETELGIYTKFSIVLPQKAA